MRHPQPGRGPHGVFPAGARSPFFYRRASPALPVCRSFSAPAGAPGLRLTSQRSLRSHAGAVLCPCPPRRAAGRPDFARPRQPGQAHNPAGRSVRAIARAHPALCGFVAPWTSCDVSCVGSGSGERRTESEGEGDRDQGGSGGGGAPARTIPIIPPRVKNGDRQGCGLLRSRAMGARLQPAGHKRRQQRAGQTTGPTCAPDALLPQQSRQPLDPKRYLIGHTVGK